MAKVNVVVINNVVNVVVDKSITLEVVERSEVKRVNLGEKLKATAIVALPFVSYIIEIILSLLTN